MAILLSLGIATIGSRAETAPTAARAVEIASSGISFEPNAGQGPSAARYLAQGRGYRVQLEAARGA